LAEPAAKHGLEVVDVCGPLPYVHRQQEPDDAVDVQGDLVDRPQRRRPVDPVRAVLTMELLNEEIG
jgi:hypothetical protein